VFLSGGYFLPIRSAWSKKKNIAQCQKAGFYVLIKFLAASKNGIFAGK
jgi:hypothetical protein